MNIDDKDILSTHLTAQSVNMEQQISDLIRECFHARRGELSVDLGGPYRAGVPVTDRIVAMHQWPKYMLVGAFLPFGEKEAKARYEQEVQDQHAAGIQGPVQLETVTKPSGQILCFVELLPAKSDAGMALIRMVNRITNQHKCKAVCRIHADRVLEFIGSRAKQLLENQGITVTSTAGHDSNANGRAERAVLFFQEK